MIIFNYIVKNCYGKLGILFAMKYKTLEEIQQNPVWLKLQSNGVDKEQLDKQFLSLTEDEKKIAIDLFESLKSVMENIIKDKKTHH